MSSSSSTTPLVSVVLTAYNRAGQLRRTIETVLSQTMRDFELLVCDDASRDHTQDVIREFVDRDSRVINDLRTANVGMPANLNLGIRRARGVFVANLHDGDLYDPTLLEKWTAALERFGNAAFVFNQYRIVGIDGRERQIHSEELPPVFPGSRLLEDIFFARWRFDSPVWGTVMARRSAYLEAGLFDPRFGCIADVDMWMRLAEKHDVAYISEPLISLVAHDSLPSNWSIPKPLVRKIFREARSRHYRGKPARRIAEMVRHHGYALGSSLYHQACLTKAKLHRSGSLVLGH